jgi:hypothetical protein
LAWLLSADFGRDKLALLVLCSASAYVVAARLSWKWRALRSIFYRALTEIVRLVYYVGVPVAVLWRGALMAELGIPTTYFGSNRVRIALQWLGVGRPQELLYLLNGLSLVAGALLVQIGVWIWYGRTLSSMPVDVPLCWWRAVWEGVLLQVQWAFYRGVVSQFTMDSNYVALSTLLLIVVPWLLDPRRRHDLYTPRGYRVIQDWMCALLGSLIAVRFEMVWPLVLSHALWLWAGGRVLARFGRKGTRSEAVGQTG